ncbi:class II aldolase/adducin family protein [Kribbella kalugense]|uniref:HCOMODA/2-hydroxy-3-carboxy-muconic semialdehyde decarboxylase n=1 Tax=Kribbella kalugense TaxID=2512221 RepID=A0A4V6Q8J1_9ACTN|nr:class II aldolase/adducin family protein [Kribbella kalugense]TDW24194.1 HCOMODA/2-hydroxy-3-carboxy-muconic semialdehyde decarboxylase [Kribbella kalugense]
MTPDAEVRIAGRALARAGLVHAYGHCSARLGTGVIVVSPAAPLGLVAPDDVCPMVPLDGPLPATVLGEVRMHRAVYRSRADVGAICRIQPPAVMALSVLGRSPRAVHGFSSYFAGGVPMFDSPVLVRDDAAAEAVAELLGGAAAIVLRGNGALVVAPDLRTAVCLAWYLEDTARTELAVLPAGSDVCLLTADEAERRATWEGGLAERMWAYLTAGDREL